MMVSGVSSKLVEIQQVGRPTPRPTNDVATHSLHARTAPATGIRAPRATAWSPLVLAVANNDRPSNKKSSLSRPRPPAWNTPRLLAHLLFLARMNPWLFDTHAPAETNDIQGTSDLHDDFRRHAGACVASWLASCLAKNHVRIRADGGLIRTVGLGKSWRLLLPNIGTAITITGPSFREAAFRKSSARNKSPAIKAAAGLPAASTVRWCGLAARGWLTSWFASVADPLESIGGPVSELAAVPAPHQQKDRDSRTT